MANGKIYRHTPFKKAYLQSAAGDAGGAIGAAYAVWHRDGGNRIGPMTHASWGPGYSDEELAAFAASQHEALRSERCVVSQFDQDEKLVDACIRELLEETRLTHSATVLKECIKSRRVFDYPYRSLLGRIITHAFHFDLEATGPLPAVSGGDDASHALWTPLAEIDPTRLHDDHYFIIRAMTKN